MPKSSKNYATVLLMGLPNVGKSVLFNHFTGLDVSCANYAGTTVEYSAGFLRGLSRPTILIDVPGTYTLEASNEAEKVAVDMLLHPGSRQAGSGHCSAAKNELNIPSAPPAAVICVLDAVNLESSLFLLYSILDYNLPLVAVLNRVDVARRKGININVQRLTERLSMPVFPTIATTGEGLPEVLQAVESKLRDEDREYQDKKDRRQNCPLTITPQDAACRAGNYSCTACGRIQKETVHDRSQSSPTSQDAGSGQAAGKGCSISTMNTKWKAAEVLAAEVRRDQDLPANSTSGKGAGTEPHWSDLLTAPWPGIPLAIIIIGTAFLLVVGMGMAIRQNLLLPLFRNYAEPFISHTIETWMAPGLWRNILIGEYGFLIKGLEWPLALVLPYVFSFYLSMAFLEDSGYLPRLGVLLDGLLNRIGISGASIIPLLLGYGCAIPAIMATRALPGRKERVITASLICLTIPCVSQSGAFITLLAEQSITVVFLLFLFSLIAAAGGGMIINYFLAGSSPVSIIELPEMLPPRMNVISKKVWSRLKRYLSDGVAPMIGAVGIAAVLYETGLMAWIGRALRPLVTSWLRMPDEASVPLILGIMRRELAIIPLLDMELNGLQLFTGAVVGLFYVPCIAVVVSLAREFNLKTALLILTGTSFTAFLAGGLAAQLGRLWF